MPPSLVLFFVVSFASLHNDAAFVDFIDETIGIVDSAAVFAVSMLQLFGFANAVHGTVSVDAF